VLRRDRVLHPRSAGIGLRPRATSAVAPSTGARRRPDPAARGSRCDRKEECPIQAAGAYKRGR